MSKPLLYIIPADWAPHLNDIEAAGMSFRGVDRALNLLVRLTRESMAGYAALPIEPTSDMIRAAAESQARDDEGDFPAVLDLIDYSGENKRVTVIRQLLVDAVTAGNLQSPAVKSEWSADELLLWLNGRYRLSLDHVSPVYGDDDDQTNEWQVTWETGSINDREFDVIGRGATVQEALTKARRYMESLGER